MATAAAIVSTVGQVRSYYDARKDKSAAKKADAAEKANLKAEQDAAKKETDAAASRKAESTPWGAMAASSRIAAEKQLLARRAGRAGSNAGAAAKSRQSQLLG